MIYNVIIIYDHFLASDGLEVTSLLFSNKDKALNEMKSLYEKYAREIIYDEDFLKTAINLEDDYEEYGVYYVEKSKDLNVVSDYRIKVSIYLKEVELN